MQISYFTIQKHSFYDSECEASDRLVCSHDLVGYIIFEPNPTHFSNRHLYPFHTTVHTFMLHTITVYYHVIGLLLLCRMIGYINVFIFNIICFS